MDYQGMKRKQLQALCKKHGIPANKSNLEMANLLASTILKINEKCISRGGGDDEVGNENENKEVVDVDVPKMVKKVRFSPDNETYEYEPTTYKQRGRRKTTLSTKSSKICTSITSRNAERDVADSVSSPTIGKKRARGRGETSIASIDDVSDVVDMGEEDGGVMKGEGKWNGGLVRRQLRSREVVIEESGEGGGGEGLAVTRKYSTRKSLRKRGNGEGGDRIPLMDEVSAENVSAGEDANPVNLLVRSKRNVRKDEDTALLSKELGKTEIIGRITRAQAKVEEKTSEIENKTETTEVRDECDQVLQFEEPVKGLGRNALRQKSIVCQKGLASETHTGKPVEPVRQSKRNQEKCIDSEPIPQEIVRRIIRSGTQFTGNAFVVESEDVGIQVREECKGPALEESSKGLDRNTSRRKSVVPQKGKVGSDGPHVKRETRKRSRNSDLEVVMEDEASIEHREEIEKVVPIGHLRSRGVVIEESGEGRAGENLVVPRKYSTRRSSRNRRNDEGSDRIPLLNVVSEENECAGEDDKCVNVPMRSKRNVRKDEGAALLDYTSCIMVEDNTSAIENKTETVEVQDECVKVLQLEEPTKGFGRNPSRKKSNMCRKGVESEILIGKGVEHGEGVRRSKRNVAKITDSEPLPQEIVRRITRFGAQIAGNESAVETGDEVDEVKKECKGAVQLEASSKILGQNASRWKFVAPQKGKVGSDGPQVKRETRKLSKNSDLEVVIEVEASVDSKEEIEEAIEPIGQLRRSRRNTVSLNSTDVTDDLEMGQTVGRMKQLSEKGSGKDVIVTNETLKFSRNASGHTSIATSNEMNENVGQPKQKHEPVLEKETLAVVGESSVAIPTRQSIWCVSKNDLIGPSLSSETVEKKQQNTSRLPIMEEDLFAEEPPIEHSGMTVSETTGNKSYSSMKCSKVLEPSNERNGSKSKLSGIRRIDSVVVSAVDSEAEEDIDTTLNLEETRSPTSLKLVSDSKDPETSEAARELVDLNEEAKIVVHNTKKMVPEGIVERDVDDQSSWSLESDADFVNDNSAATECDVGSPADGFSSANQVDYAGLKKGLEREDFLMGNDIPHEINHAIDHSTKDDHISAQDDGVCGLEMTEQDITTDKKEHAEVPHNGRASPEVGTEHVIESVKARFKVDGNVLPPIDETVAKVAEEKDNVFLEGNSYNVSELSRQECAHKLLDREGIHLITPEKTDTSGEENYSATIVSLQSSRTLCTSRQDNDERQQVSGIGSKRLSFHVGNFSVDRNMQHGEENQLEDQLVSAITDNHAVERVVVLHEHESFVSSTCDVNDAANEKIITQINSNSEDKKAILEGIQADLLPHSSLEEYQDEKEGNTVIAKSAYDEVLCQENFGDCTGEKREVKLHFHDKVGNSLPFEPSTISSPETLSENLHDYKEMLAESNCSDDANIVVPVSKLHVAVMDMVKGKCINKESDIKQCETEEESGHTVEVELGDHSGCWEVASKGNTAGSKEMVSASRWSFMIGKATVIEEAPIEDTGLTMPEAMSDKNQLSLNCNEEVFQTSNKSKGSKSKSNGSGIGFVDVSAACSETEEYKGTTINLEEIQASTLLKLVDASADQEIPETARQNAVVNEETNNMGDNTEKVVPDGIVEGDVDDQSCQVLKSSAYFVNDKSAEPEVAAFQTKACDVVPPTDGFSSANRVDFADEPSSLLGLEIGHERDEQSMGKEIYCRSINANKHSTEVDRISALDDGACGLERTEQDTTAVENEHKELPPNGRTLSAVGSAIILERTEASFNVDGYVFPPIDITVAQVAEEKEIAPEGNSHSVSEVCRENRVQKLLDGEGTCLIAPEEKDTDEGENYSAASLSFSGIGNKSLLFCVSNVSMDRNMQHQEENKLEDPPTSSFTDNHGIERGDVILHEDEDFITYPCDIGHTADEKIITKGNSNYEDEKAVLEGIQADALCQSFLEWLQDEKEHNTAIAKIAYDEVLCQKNFEDCTGEKREEVDASFHNNDGKNLSLEASTAPNSPDSPELLSDYLQDYKEMFAERNCSVSSDLPVSKCVDRESDIEQLQMEEESCCSVQIELGDHSGCQKVFENVNIGAGKSFIQTIGEEIEVSEEENGEMTIGCPSDYYVACKEMITGMLIERGSNTVQYAPVIRDENAECAPVVDLCDQCGSKDVAAKVNDSADETLTWTICQKSEFNEGKNIGLRDNTSKNVKRIDTLEETKPEVGDSNVDAFAQVIVDHLDEVEAAEVHDSNFCDDTCRNGRATDKETHTVSIKSLDMKKANHGGTSQQNSPVGEFSDAGPDALSDIVSVDLEDFNKPLNGVVDTMFELDVRAGKLDKMDVLEPEQSGLMDAEAAEIKENARKMDDDLKFKDTGTDAEKDHILAIPLATVNCITQHVIEEELFDENTSDYNIISNVACRNIQVDADVAHAMSIDGKICFENSDHYTEWTENGPISSDILTSSRKQVKQNSVEGILFADKSFGKAELGSNIDSVSELNFSSSHENLPSKSHAGSALFTNWEMNLIQGNGEQDQVEKSDGETFEDNLTSKDSWHPMLVQENATIVELDGQFAEKQLGEDGPVSYDGDLSDGLDYKSGISQQFVDENHNDKMAENDRSYVSTNQVILINAASIDSLDKHMAECAPDNMKEVESISSFVVQGMCESVASATNKQLCIPTVRKVEVGIEQALLPGISDEASHEEFESQDYCKDVSRDAGGKETTCNEGSNPIEASQILQEEEDDEVTIVQNSGTQKSSEPQKVAKKQLNEHEDEVNEPTFLVGSVCLALNQSSCENKIKSHAIEPDEAQCLHKLGDKILTTVHSKEAVDFEHQDVISPFKCEMVAGCSVDSAVEGEQEEKSGALAFQTNFTGEDSGEVQENTTIEQTATQVAEEEHGDHMHQLEVGVAVIAAADEQRCQLNLPSPQRTSSLAKPEESTSFYAKQSTSSAMKRKNRTVMIQETPQKVRYSSDMKENVPSIKRQQIGNMTAPKTLPKRRALEDLSDRIRFSGLH